MQVDMNSGLNFIDRLLVTNGPPTSEQTCFIQNELTGPETKLLELRTEIAATRKKLESLVQKEKILTQEITPYRLILDSPFRSLPDDILRLIFLACLPHDYIPVIDFRQPPLLLTHISSHLRQVAFTTPRLWTEISVPIIAPCLTEWYDGRDQSRIAHSIRTMTKYVWAVDQWLCRVGGCDIEIFVTEIGPHTASWCTDDIFKLLITRMSQWKRISLHCSAYSVQRFCYMLGQSSFEEVNFPRLKHLSINISGEYLDQDDPQEQYNNASHFPYAFLDSIHLAIPTDNYEGYCVQWSCLTYLSLGSALYPSSQSSIVKILESCAGLLGCKLYIKVDNTKLRLCLQHLKAISLVFDQETWFDFNMYNLQTETAFTFFNQLDSPTLERITYDASPDFTPLLGLLRRIGNHITHLSVTNFEVPTELIECLKACPLLVALDVSRQDGIPRSPTRNSQFLRPALSTPFILWSTAGDQLLRYLMPAGDIDEIICEQLCPRLEYLAYHIADGAISRTAIEAFILNKCGTQGNNAGLKGFSVNIRGGEQEIICIRLSVEAQLLNGLSLQIIPGRTTPKVMPTYANPVTGKPKWWDNVMMSEG